MPSRKAEVLTKQKKQMRKQLRPLLILELTGVWDPEKTLDHCKENFHFFTLQTL